MRERSSAAAPKARSTACGVAVALVLGLALIATGAQMTSRQSGVAMDGAHVLRQARWTLPQQQQQLQRQAPAAAEAAVVPTPSVSVPSVLPADVGGKGACLVSKWGAVWLVHADGKTRSHVSVPTAECDLHASIIEDMEKYTKSHGGEGAYTLDERQSNDACQRPGCTRSQPMQHVSPNGNYTVYHTYTHTYTR